MAPHSSTLAWKIPWTEEPGRLQSMGSQESDTTERLHFHFSLSCIGEGYGNPLQCSCLENPKDGGAWWAAVCGVSQNWTRLKRLSSSSRWVWQPVLANILQYSCLENPLCDREACHATIYRVTQDRSDPACINTRLFFFFACGNSAPVRVDCESSAAAWLMGTLEAPVVQGQDCLCGRN